jgi:acyl-CoA synthetase (AMP-forming)/AMP-acid ligase II
VAGASPSYGVEEMAYLLRISEAKFIMTVPDSLAVATAAASSVGIHQNQIFLLEGSKSGFANLKDLILLGEMVTNASSLLEPYRIPPGKTNHDICGYLSFSSGTTGKPKAVSQLHIHPFPPSTDISNQVMISHQNVIAQCLQMGAITSPDVDKVFAVLPLYHSPYSTQVELSPQS